MRSIHLAAGLACGILLLLFFLVNKVEKPELLQYEKTIDKLMIQEGMSSREEVVTRFPELGVIQSKIERIQDLSQMIQRMTEGPAPEISVEQGHQLQAYIKERQQLQRWVKKGLAILVNLPTTVAP